MFKKTLAASLIGAAAALLLPAHAANNTNKLTALGLTDDGRLISFKLASPAGTTREIGSIQGLVTDTALIGIDFRVQDGKLYGVGNAGGIYTIDTANATATFVNQLTVAGVPVVLAGSRFGVDFNPAADRLRIVSDSGQNFRHNVNAGGMTVADGTLNNSAIPPVTVNGIAGSAYTNNDDSNANPAASTTGTVLFNVNADSGQLVVQIPPNSGGINVIGSLAVPGPMGNAGLDIHSDLNEAGVTVGNRAFAALATEAGTSVYSVDLTTGRATEIGPVRVGYSLRDIALPLGQ